MTFFKAGTNINDVKTVLAFLFLISHAWAQSSVNNSFSTHLLEQLSKCYPEVKIKELEKKGTTLTVLKSLLDEQLFVLRTDLKSRSVEFRDSDGISKRLKLVQARTKIGVPEYRLELEKVDKNGVGTKIDLPKDHQINPSQILVSSYLSGADIKSDEKETFDTRLNDLQMTTHWLKDEVVSFNLAPLKGKKELSCEQTLQNAAVCICRQPSK